MTLATLAALIWPTAVILGGFVLADLFLGGR